MSYSGLNKSHRCGCNFSLFWNSLRTASLASPFVVTPKSEIFVLGRMPVVMKSKRSMFSSLNFAIASIGNRRSLHAEIKLIRFFGRGSLAEQPELAELPVGGGKFAVNVAKCAGFSNNLS